MAGKTTKRRTSRSGGGSTRKPKSRSTRGKKTGRSGKKSAAQAKRQREIFAVVLAILAVFVAVALVPLGLLGPGSADLFPSGNPMGLLGGTLKALLVAGLGAGSAAVPMALALTAAWIGGWLSSEVVRRGWALAAGALVIPPFAAAVAGGGAASTGHLGVALARPSVAILGWLGGWLLVGAGVVLTSVFAFSVNPLGLLGTGTVRAARGVGRTSQAAGSRAAAWWEERKRLREEERARAEAAVPARPRREPYDGAVADREGASEPVVSGGEDTEEASPPEAIDRDGDLLPEAPAPPTDHPLPTLDLLTPAARENRLGMERELDRLGGVLVEKLQTFNVSCEMGGRTTGPVVTQYEVVPAPGVKVNRIANLDADLALAMRARSIRIVAPIPGKGAVGVEIPNPEPEVVRLREILEAPAFSRSRSILPLGLGKDLTGHPFVSDLTKMPHALIAGATGSGKSVCLNTVITSPRVQARPRSTQAPAHRSQDGRAVCVLRSAPPPPPRGHGSSRRGWCLEMGGPGDGAPVRAPQRQRRSLPGRVQ